MPSTPLITWDNVTPGDGALMPLQTRWGWVFVANSAEIISSASASRWMIGDNQRNALGETETTSTVSDNASFPRSIGGILIDKQIVHKGASSEVLLTAIAKLRGEVWTFGYELPRGHWTARENSSNTVPLILGLELVRQAGIATTHLQADVPLDWRFILQRIKFAWLQEAATFPSFRPLEGHITVHMRELRRRRGKVSGLKAVIAMMDSCNRQIARGGGEIDFLPPQTYNLLRRNAHNGQLGEESNETLINPLVTEDSLVAGLGWDAGDPFEFDHRSDHVPGMVLAAAGIRSHQLLAPTALPTSIAMTCQKFLEYAPQPLVECELLSPHMSQTIIRQGGVSSAHISCQSFGEEKTRTHEA